MKYYRLLLPAAALLATAAYAMENGNESEWETLLKEQEKNYPGCVMVVRDQLAQVPDDQYNELTPVLLDTCITGREIGEKRTKQMYEIPKSTKPRKLGGFTIKIEPPGTGRDDEWDVRYR